MCGLSGIINLQHKQVDPAIIHRMSNCMAHRGPDADGFYIKDEVALGHRRLSIIDLSATANQPMFDASGRYAMIFNGEMYNFAEVKRQLTGYPFKTHSDSEVILAAYSKWGADCLEKLGGMFVFVIWDLINHELFIARDRMGVKPLYYYVDANHFVFASEIRALLQSGLVPAKIDHAAVDDFLEFQSISFPHSIIENVKQLEAGAYLRVRSGKLETKKYWDITATRKQFDFSNKQVIQKQLYTLLRQSIERRMISDVPLGAFLSGGIDSSAVVALMAESSSKPINTFNIGFEEKEFDESEYAAIVAKKFNTRHNSVRLSPNIFLDELNNALNSMDTPSGDGVNTYVVSKQIKQSGLTVALSGVGGDELFAGYPFFTRYYRLKQNRSLWKWMKPIRKFGSGFVGLNGNMQKDRIRQLLQTDEISIDECYPLFRQILSPRIISKLTTHPLHANSIVSDLLEKHETVIDSFPYLSQVSIAEYLGYTQHTLLKDTDQMSMAVSLEVREPFFDHQLVEFVLNVPDQYKYPDYPKRLLVESLGDLLPAEIVHRRKQGFLFPWSVWMKRELKTFCEERLNKIAGRSFINSNALLQRWNEFLKGDRSVRWMELWLFVILEHWLEKNHVD
jgi:asparagine synthase (glutamine-hydrolysing)